MTSRTLTPLGFCLAHGLLVILLAIAGGLILSYLVEDPLMYSQFNPAYPDPRDWQR